MRLSVLPSIALLVVAAPILTAQTPIAFDPDHLPVAVLGMPYSQTITLRGAVQPLRVSIEGDELPVGLALDSSRSTISGVPERLGPPSFFRLQAVDARGLVASQVFSITVEAPEPASLRVDVSGNAGADNTTRPRSYIMDSYTLNLNGTLTVGFLPDPELPVADQTIRLIRDGKPVNSNSVSFTIPAGANEAEFGADVSLYTGTSAGDIFVFSSVRVGGLDITPSFIPTYIIRIPKATPVIMKVQLSRVQRSPMLSGLDAIIHGYSTAREVTKATVTFGPNRPAEEHFEFNVQQAFASYFATTSAGEVGSKFELIVPFSVQNNADAIRSLTVTLENSLGSTRRSSDESP